MELNTAWADVPDADDDLAYSIEHWDSDKIATRDAPHTDSEIEAFVHPRTATAARILQTGGSTYSVQPSTGDYDNGDCVNQSDDPTSFVSGGALVLATEIETLSEARALAYAWLHGWVTRNSSVRPEPKEGDVLDGENYPNFDPIR